MISQLISDFKITVTALALCKTHMAIGTDTSIHIYDFSQSLFIFYRKTRSIFNITMSGLHVSFQDALYIDQEYRQPKLWFINLSHKKKRLYQLRNEEGNSIVVFKFDQNQLYTLNNLHEFRVWDLVKKKPRYTVKLKQIVEDFALTSKFILMNTKINRLVVHYHTSMRMLYKQKVKATHLYSIAFNTLILLEGEQEANTYQWHRSQSRLIRKISTAGLQDEISVQGKYISIRNANQLSAVEISTGRIFGIKNLDSLGYQFRLHNDVLICDQGDCVKVYKIMKQ